MITAGEAATILLLPLKLQSGKAEVNLRVVKYKLGKKNTKKDGSWTRDGYIVFGLLTPQLCTQTTTTLLKVKFQAEGKPEDGKDSLGLYLYKIHSNSNDEEDATMALMSDATLKGAVYTVKFFKDADFVSVKELKKD